MPDKHLQRERRQPRSAATAEPADARYVHDADGWLFRQEMVDCGKSETGRCRKCANGPGHGPYWYRYRWEDGKMHKRYVGKRLPESASQARQSIDSSGGRSELRRDRHSNGFSQPTV
jgi:hypothetical protein